MTLIFLVALISAVVSSELAGGIRSSAESSRNVKVIAHRGGSMIYPQSSAAAYLERVRLRDADFLECDVGVTSDGVLVCQHEPDLTRSSDAELRMALPAKDLRVEWLDPVLDFISPPKGDDDLDDTPTTLPFMREDARPSLGWFTPDYPWKDTISRLNAPCAYHQRCIDYNTTHYPVATLEDLWALAEQTNVGLYFEIKHSTWLKSRRNIDLLAYLVSYIENKRRTAALQGRSEFQIYLQSFEVTDLMRLRQYFGYNSNISLVALVTSLHTTFRLPPDCCLQNQDLRQKLTTYANQPFFRLPGTVGEMFYSSSFCVPLDATCQNPIHGLQIHPVALKPVQPDAAAQPEPLAQPLPIESHRDTRKSRCNPKLQLSDKHFPEQIHDLSCLADSLALDLRLLRAHPEIAQELASANIPLHVWTVRTPSDMKFVAAHSVDGVITDDAAMSMRFLNRHDRPIPK